jgi:hypothetical protein
MSGRRSSNKGARTERAMRLLLGHGLPARDLLGRLDGRKYERLSRYDQNGLAWMLQGRRVIALTETEATILAPSGATLVYRRRNQPAPGLIGDSTDGGGVEP